MTFWDVESIARSLDRALEPPAGTDPVELAQSIVWIGVVTRKLADAGLLPSELERKCWPVRLHWPRPGARAGYCNWRDYESVYELGASRAAELSTMRLSGLLVHSFILVPVLGKRDEPLGVRFTSMLTRDEGLYHLEWRRLRQLVDHVCAAAAGSGVIHA